MNLRARHTLALLVAAAFASQSLLSLAHRAQRHVRCVEHGELVDVDDAGSAARLAEKPAPADSASGTRRSVDENHHHCLVLATRHESAAAAPNGPRTASDLGQSLAPAPLLTAAPRARALYHTAPKTSPPA